MRLLIIDLLINFLLKINLFFFFPTKAEELHHTECRYEELWDLYLISLAFPVSQILELIFVPLKPRRVSEWKEKYLLSPPHIVSEHAPISSSRLLFCFYLQEAIIILT